MVTAYDVAVELHKRLPDLRTTKKHKLLYYCQGHHLATFGAPLFGDGISAFDHGPVVATLWYAERSADPALHETAPVRLNEGELNTIGYVVHRYGALTARDLEHLTHAESPWQRANADRPMGQSRRIEVDWILEYFAEQDAREDDDATLLDAAAVKEFLSGAVERLNRPSQPDDLDELRRLLVGG